MQKAVLDELEDCALEEELDLTLELEELERTELETELLDELERMLDELERMLEELELLDERMDEEELPFPPPI